MGSIDNFDIVKCYISVNGNRSLFNEMVLQEKLSRRIAQICEKNGVKFEIISPGGMGGGGVNEFLYLIKELIDNKEIILLFIVILKKIITLLFNLIYSLMINRFNNGKARINLSLRIETTEVTFFYSYFEWIRKDIMNRLFSLNYLSRLIFKSLSAEYPLFLFDLTIEAKIINEEFSISYLTPHEKNNNFNSFRLSNLIKGILIRNKVSYIFAFSPNFFITRTDSLLGNTQKNYYLILSSRVITDYLYIIKQFIKRLVYKWKQDPLG